MIKRMCLVLTIAIGAAALSPSYASHPSKDGKAASDADDEHEQCDCTDDASEDCKAHRQADEDDGHEHRCEPDEHKH